MIWAIENSPKLAANDSSPPVTRPDEMFGRTTRRMICSGDAPQASAVSLRRSIPAAAIAPSTAQYTNGKAIAAWPMTSSGNVPWYCGATTPENCICLLYTSDAADEEDSVD